MNYVFATYGIVQNEIFGYSVIVGNTMPNELYEFPGFKLLHQHMNERNPAFVFWIKSPELRRGGILKRYNTLHPAQGSGIEESGKVCPVCA